MTATALSGKRSSALTSDTEFYLVLLLPAGAALSCHLLGCLFLHLHYKATHPWRQLFIWQRKEGMKDGIEEEVPFWEEVSWLYIQRRITFLLRRKRGKRRRWWSLLESFRKERKR